MLRGRRLYQQRQLLVRQKPQQGNNEKRRIKKHRNTENKPRKGFGRNINEDKTKKKEVKKGKDDEN